MKKVGLLTLMTVWLALAGVVSAASAPGPVVEREAGSPFSMVKGRLAYKGQPFTGTALVRYGNGQMKRETLYKEGLREGSDRYWDETGAQLYEQYYRGDVEEGLQRGWWPSGLLRFEYVAKEGRKEGQAKEWYENGQLASQMNFLKGREEGLQEGWSRTGQQVYRYTMKNGRRFGLLGPRVCN